MKVQSQLAESRAEEESDFFFVTIITTEATGSNDNMNIFFHGRDTHFTWTEGELVPRREDLEQPLLATFPDDLCS